MAGTAPPYDPAHGGSAAAGKPGHLDWEADIGAGTADAPAGEDIPGRLAALRKTVGTKVKETEPLEVPKKKKKSEKDGEVVDKETRTKSRKRKKRSDPAPMWFGHAKEPASDDEDSSSDGIAPTGKRRTDKSEDRRGDEPLRTAKRKKGKRPKKGSTSARKAKQAGPGLCKPGANKDTCAGL